MKQMSSLSIRPAKIEDASALAELATQLGYPSTLEQILERFDALYANQEENTVIVAELDGKVTGWIHAYIYRLLMSDPEVEIGGLVIDESIRGHGVGEKLMQAAEAWTLEKGCSSVYVRSNTIRTRAHKFYKRIGYQVIKSQYAFRKILR
jgi:N-acetylglutamate synthase-like GNAT family acetyltransferase